jgi:hypothetical protein
MIINSIPKITNGLPAYVTYFPPMNTDASSKYVNTASIATTTIHHQFIWLSMLNPEMSTTGVIEPVPHQS